MSHRFSVAGENHVVCHTFSEVNRTIRRYLFSDLEQNLRHVFPYLNHNSAVSYRIILQDKLHSFNIQDDWSARFPCKTNYKKQRHHKTFLYREFTIRRDWSVRSICHYVVRTVIMGFEQKHSKKIYFNSIYKITRPTGQF